ncbi:ImcF-related family protein, partial [Achromobacter sp. UBA5777]
GAARTAPPPQAQPVSANAGNTLFQDASPTNVDDAYNALKTYLMMANREHVDP